MASEYTLTEEQMRSVADRALAMVAAQQREGFAAPPAAAAFVPVGASLSAAAAAAAPYASLVTASRAPPAPAPAPAAAAAGPLGAYSAPGGFASWAAAPL